MMNISTAPVLILMIPTIIALLVEYV